MPTRADWLWLTGIVGVGVALRVVGLNSGLWYDEIDTLVHHARQPVSELLTTYPSLNHHVLFTLEAKGAITLFGESAWALRLPAFLFGVGSIVALWFVAREAVSVWAARLAALLMAVSYHHVWFSQNARGYTGMLFFGLVGTYCLLRARDRPSWGVWTAFGIASGLAVYTHLSAALFVAAQFVAWCWLVLRPDSGGPARSPGTAGRDSFLRALYGFGLATVLALLFHAPMLPQMVATFTGVAAPQPALEAASTAEWKSSQWMILEVARSLGPALGLGLPVILVVVVAGMLGLRQRAPLLPGIVLVHIPLTLVALTLASMRVWPRYFFVDIGLLCLLTIHGAFVLGQLVAQGAEKRFRIAVDGTRLGTIAAVAGIAASLVLLPRNYLHPKQDFVGAREFVEASRGRDSQVLVLGLAAMPYVEYYAPAWREVASLAEVENARGKHAEVWLVYAFPAVTERRYPGLRGLAAGQTDLARRFPGTLGGGDVKVLRLRTGAADIRGAS